MNWKTPQTFGVPKRILRDTGIKIFKTDEIGTSGIPKRVFCKT